MTSKRKANANLTDSNQIQFLQAKDESESETFNRNAIVPSVGAAITIKAFTKKFGDGVTYKGLIPAIEDQVKDAQTGDLNRTEAMLIAQAHTLDAIFNELAQRAAANMGQYMNATDLYLRLALKAQSQCRATLETLAEIKFPKSATFVRQQNVGISQQVNNCEPTPNVPRARENSAIPTNKLLEKNSNGWQTNGLDTGTTGTTSGFNGELETVGTFDRASE
jgi:hypothetical protein